MIGHIFFILLICTSIVKGILAQPSNADRQIFEIGYFPELPHAAGQEEQYGLAGAFSGMSDGAIIVAGGANFPGLKPWENGQKVWWDDIYILREKAPDEYEWLVRADFKLPETLAYGVSIQTDEGIVCIGGDNGVSKSKEVFLLKWDNAKEEISFEDLPSLPRPLGFMSGDRLGDVIYVTGGLEKDASTRNFFALDLTKKGSSDFEWEELPPWPGPARMLGVTVAQSDGKENVLFLFGGRDVQPGKKMSILSDAYAYSPSAKEWKALEEMGTGHKTTTLMAGTAVAKGSHHIVFFGGSDARILRKLLALKEAYRDTAKSEEEIQALKDQEIDVLENHPGFSRNVLSYNTITGTWTKIGELPKGSPVTTNAFTHRGCTVIASGEISPGIRTKEMLQIKWKKVNASFGTTNYIIVFIYLIAMVLIGVFFSMRQKSTTDYFKGGGRVPWWAAGLSIFGTMLSAITFMAIPAKTYATDWAYFMLNMTIILVAPLISWLFIPFYNKLNITSAYEYLELRFNVLTRLLGSASFLIFQLGRIGIVLFLPSIAISIVTGVDVRVCILVMGILSVIYTVIGGIEAVIWTDVVQVIVLLGGALLSFFLIVSSLEEGFGALMTVAAQDNKFEIFNFSFDFTQPTFWVVVIGGVGTNIITQGTDQSIVQRYITNPDLKNSRKTLYTNAVLVFPASILFFGMGTALYVFFKANPGDLPPLLTNNDAIFPWYIVSQLPIGVAGLMIAAIFSAAMSSLSSSMNSGATAFCKDFYQRFNPGRNDAQLLVAAKWMTLVIGIAGTLFGLWMASSDVKSLWDEFQKVLGLFTGGLGGVFLLGMLFNRANGKGAVIGITGSGIVQWAVVRYTDLNLLLFTMTGLVACVAIGYMASFLFSEDEKNESR
ncbi:MAG: sodium/solute symporter [Cytophagales bacterium]|nr:sodium/solute symporter [Cytophagales bacterium]